MDNTENLRTVLPRNVIDRKITQNEITKEWLLEEICHAAGSPNYFWHVKKIEFDTEEELKSYVFLDMLELGI
jgi:hypothetical protein